MSNDGRCVGKNSPPVNSAASDCSKFEVSHTKDDFSRRQVSGSDVHQFDGNCQLSIV